MCLSGFPITRDHVAIPCDSGDLGRVGRIVVVHGDFLFSRMENFCGTKEFRNETEKQKPPFRRRSDLSVLGFSDPR